MPAKLRGALIEYRSDFLDKLPNVVVFQFNPEHLDRKISLATIVKDDNGKETLSDPTTLESFTISIVFDAQERMSADEWFSKAFGVGQSLAALENMAKPTTFLAGSQSEMKDAVALALGSRPTPPIQPVPHDRVPKILFMWGHTRVLPVTITEMGLKEVKYDSQLIPVRAEVTIKVSVPLLTSNDDKLGYGALAFTRGMREVQALTNFLDTTRAIIDLIRF
jgi:hypothetical protein